MVFTLRSPAFRHERASPERHTCDDLGEAPAPKRDALEPAIGGHRLASTTSMGTYEKKKGK